MNAECLTMDAEKERLASTIEKSLALLDKNTREAEMEAHFLLANEYHHDLNRPRLGQIANMIVPCGFITEAKDALMKWKWELIYG